MICFPILKSCISPTRSTEAEGAASGVRRLKIPFRNTIGEQSESILKLLQLQRVQDGDIDQAVANLY